MSDLPPPPNQPPWDTPPGGPQPQDAPPGAPPPYPGQPGQPGYGQSPYAQAPHYGQYGQYAQYGPPRGAVPQSLDEVYYKPWLNILLFVVTCGIWGAVWAYRTHDDLQKHNGDGLGGIFGLVVGLLVSVVIMFTVPMEIERMYQRDGRQSPVSTLWGLWFLLPVIGEFIWYLKVQEALNEFWLSKGARPAA